MFATARCLLLAVLVAVSVSAPGIPLAEESTPQLTGARHHLHQDRLRLIVEISPAPVFTLFMLNEPDRLVIDFPLLDWQAPDNVFDGTPYLAQVRYGLFQRDRSRIVVDLTEPLVVERAFTQVARGNEPGRLIIDLAPTRREAFDETAGWPEQARWRGEAPILPDLPGDGAILVAIDPGHGGIDPGTSFGKLTEKKIVLDFARRLAERVNAMDGYAAYLIRDRDEFVPLAERVARAHRVGANLLLSIHVDSVASGLASGVSAYTLSTTGTDDAADALAARENRADILAGADLGGETDELTRLLVELAQRGTQVESIKLADALIASLGKSVKLIKSRPHRQAGFRVLKAPDIPSVLLELGFLDNPADRRRLTDPEWLERAAEAMAKGVSQWSRVASPGFLKPRRPQ
ncbi:MAG: N-acetylmuramoyl-L-alanine amidase [Pseudomonadota bacterium]